MNERVRVIPMSDNGPQIPARVDVLVVGGGPTGLTAANLLGSMGLKVALVERNSTTSDEAKAISLDDESMRTFQVANLDQAVAPIIVPGTGTRYYSSSGKKLLHARGPKGRRHGHSFKNPFAQPDLERALAAGLRRFENVSFHFGSELIDLVIGPEYVEVTVRTLASTNTTIKATYVLGCDGGRSKVRELLGIEMEGRSFPDLWLVADTLGDTHDERYGMHVGDPSRPHVIVPGQNGRCRYEFKLRPGEATAGNTPPFELVQRLVGRYRDLQADQLERSVVYGFHALLAASFGRERCFLLGDAAHMMPPFAGQGLNSGVRDAMNLCWKVAAVIAQRARPELLVTYEQERRPHARATIDLSVRLGSVVMTSSRVRAHLRDLAVGAAMRIPFSRRYLSEMRYRPTGGFTSGFVLPTKGPAGKVVGRAIGQPQVLSAAVNSAVRLDDVLGIGFALVGVAVGSPAWDAVESSGLLTHVDKCVEVFLDDRSPKATERYDSVADVDGQLEAMLEPLRGLFLLIRPDRVIAAAFLPSSVSEVVTAFEPYFCNPPAPVGELPALPFTPNEEAV